MEEPKPAENTTQTISPQPPPQPPAPSLPPKTKKRPLDSNAHLQDSHYYKMRLLLKDLRPHFIEVLRAPDFQNCKASHEIREQIRNLMELYKQMTAETVSTTKCKDAPENQQHQDVKPAEQPPPPQGPQQDGIIAKPSENKPLPEDGETQGSYIVGGSAFGWNFITFPGSQPVYYGVTKELFRKLNLEGQ